MRYMTSFLVVAIAILIMAFGTKGTTLTEGTKPGNLAPEIQLQGCTLKCEKYVLLQFWAAYSPESRANNVLMHNEISKMQKRNLKFLSISFDESKSVFEETVKADKLDTLTQLNDPQGEKSDVFKNYKLDRGFGNVLINPQGLVIARNISLEELNSIRF